VDQGERVTVSKSLYEICTGAGKPFCMTNHKLRNDYEKNNEKSKITKNRINQSNALGGIRRIGTPIVSTQCRSAGGLQYRPK
jgi:hypothetical protein